MSRIGDSTGRSTIWPVVIYEFYVDYFNVRTQYSCNGCTVVNTVVIKDRHFAITMKSCVSGVVVIDNADSEITSRLVPLVELSLHHHDYDKTISELDASVTVACLSPIHLFSPLSGRYLECEFPSLEDNATSH